MILGMHLWRWPTANHTSQTRLIKGRRILSVSRSSKVNYFTGKFRARAASASVKMLSGAFNGRRKGASTKFWCDPFLSVMRYAIWREDLERFG
jgi:hypothetical protein